MRNPCIGCPNYGDYDSHACQNCRKRAAYVTAMGGMTCSMPVALTDLCGRRREEKIVKTPKPKTPAGMKVCSRKDCKHGGKPQLLNDFGNNKNKSDGKQVYCKACHREAAQRHYRKKQVAKAKTKAPAAPANPDNGDRASDAYAGDALLSELFGENDLLLDGLHELADRELRTPRNQLLYLVQTATKEMTHGAEK